MPSAKSLGDRLYRACVNEYNESTLAYHERTRGAVIDKLRRWRNADHEDAIVLSRHEVCTLLDAID